MNTHPETIQVLNPEQSYKYDSKIESEKYRLYCQDIIQIINSLSNLADTSYVYPNDYGDDQLIESGDHLIIKDSSILEKLVEGAFHPSIGDVAEGHYGYTIKHLWKAGDDILDIAYEQFKAFSLLYGKSRRFLYWERFPENINAKRFMLYKKRDNSARGYQFYIINEKIERLVYSFSARIFSAIDNLWHMIGETYAKDTPRNNSLKSSVRKIVRVRNPELHQYLMCELNGKTNYQIEDIFETRNSFHHRIPTRRIIPVVRPYKIEEKAGKTSQEYNTFDFCIGIADNGNMKLFNLINYLGRHLQLTQNKISKAITFLMKGLEQEESEKRKDQAYAKQHWQRVLEKAKEMGIEQRVTAKGTECIIKVQNLS